MRATARPPRPSSRRPPSDAAWRTASGGSPRALAATEKLKKVLARAGFGARRDMESWIAAGRVMVNGAPAHVGQRVAPRDRIQLDGRQVDRGRERGETRVLLYHKPAGEIVSADDPGGRPTVFDRLPRRRGDRWIAVGRLDFNSSGLLLFTTSGELAARLAHPRYETEREYAVRVNGTLDAEALRALSEGVLLEDGRARFTAIADEGGQGRNHWYRVVLKEGRNREIRRMLAAVGYSVSRLMRIRFGPVRLPPGLKRGRFRELDPAAVAELVAASAVEPSPARAPRRRPS
jgi:23S rRNA pseudouridine2605 synthase